MQNSILSAGTIHCQKHGFFFSSTVTYQSIISRSDNSTRHIPSYIPYTMPISAKFFEEFASILKNIDTYNSHLARVILEERTESSTNQFLELLTAWTHSTCKRYHTNSRRYTG